MKKIQLMIFTLVCVLILTATSCSLGGDSNSNPDQGMFLVANISPDSPPLSMNINGSSFSANLNYGNYTPYYIATAGSYKFDFYGTGTAPVLTKTVNIETSKRYSSFVIDSFSTLKLSFVEDKLFQPAADSVYVRFFNFSPDSQPVNLYDSASKTKLYSMRYFNDEASNAIYTEFGRVKAGIYTLRLTTPSDSVLATRKDTLTGGHIYSLFAKGFVGGTGNQAIGIGQLIHY
ncbi:MAG TPA: DUF4397 domain-containing protein [Parafilimonas sp.]|nr:DUF4397 domain-containing protein [Parafilimonas sp.]